MSRTKLVVKAIKDRDLAKLSELLEDETLDVLEKVKGFPFIEDNLPLLWVPLTTDLTWYDEKWDQGWYEGICLMIEKKNPNLRVSFKIDGYEANIQYHMFVEEYEYHNTKMMRPFWISHLLNDIDIEDNTFLVEKKRPLFRRKHFVNWYIVQRCYRRLNSDPNAQIMNTEWYKRQTFERQGRYSKECHLGWAIAFLYKYNNGLKNLGKWGIAHALKVFGQHNQVVQGIAMSSPRVSLKY